MNQMLNKDNFKKIKITEVIVFQFYIKPLQTYTSQTSFTCNIVIYVSEYSYYATLNFFSCHDINADLTF